MSGRHQPLHGADSAEALDPEIRALIVDGSWELDPHCAACSLPAVTEGYCAGHSRLFDYTDRERAGGIAANE